MFRAQYHAGLAIGVNDTIYWLRTNSKQQLLFAAKGAKNAREFKKYGTMQNHKFFFVVAGNPPYFFRPFFASFASFGVK